MIALLVRIAVAADPEPVAPAEPSPELLELQGALEALQQTHGVTLSEVELTRRELGSVRALLESASILLDDRRTLDERTTAAQGLAATGDPRAVPILRAGARDRDPEVQLASALAALDLADHGGAEVARVVLADPFAPKALRVSLLQTVAERGVPGTADVLIAISEDADVSSRVRSEAVRQLAERYPEQLAKRGGAPRVVDPLGGVLFVAANGVAGGVLLSSVGAWGALGEAEAVGAVGGSVVGLGGGAIYAATRPLTFGQGLAYTSGVSWGLTYGIWGSATANGPLRYLPYEERDPALGAAAAYRAVGVLGGVGIGIYALVRDPTPADVLEIDAAGYLGSALALGATALVGYHPTELETFGPGPVRGTFQVTSTTITTGSGDDSYPYADYETAAFRRHAGAQLVGATAGLLAGAWLHPRWELEPHDGLFAVVLGAQAGWLGNATPALVGADPQRVKGNIRLPMHAGIAGGLVLAELSDIPAGRSASTAWGSLAGDALGAGLPMLVGYDDPRSVAAWMIPIGAIGTAGGLLAHPHVDPTLGDAVMIGVGTSIVATEAALVGLSLDELGALRDSGQAEGLIATASGATGAVLYGLAATVEPRAADMLVLGSATAWGTFYGAMVPVAAKLDPNAAGTMLPAAVTSSLATAGAGVALELGLEPRQTLIPQLAAASGATVGALSAGLSSSNGEDAALGSLIGATVGFGVGAAIEVGRNNRAQAVALHWRVPGVWTPLLQPRVADGGLGAVVGVQGSGW